MPWLLILLESEPAQNPGRNSDGGAKGLSDWPATLSLSGGGGAVFTANGSSTMEVTSDAGGAVADQAIRVVTSDPVTITVSTRVPAPPQISEGTITRNNGRTTAGQRMWPAGKWDNLAVSTDPVQIPVTITPTITTDAEATLNDDGTYTLADNVTVTWDAEKLPTGPNGEMQDVSLVAEVTAYGPYETPSEPGTALEADKAIATKVLTFTESGQTLSTKDAMDRAAIIVPADGFYTFQGRILVADQAEGLRQFLDGDVADVPWARPETVVAPGQGEAVSTVKPSTKKVMVGDEVTDKIVLSQFPATHPGFTGANGFGGDLDAVQHHLVGPFEQAITEENYPSLTLADAPIEASVTTSAADSSTGLTNGVYDVTFTPAKVGNYVVVTQFTGDARTEAFETSVYDESEQLLVVADPTTVTQAQPEAIPGGDFNDVVDVEDEDDYIAWTTENGYYEWQVTFEAYYAGDVPPLELDENGIVVGEITPEIERICTGEPFFTGSTVVTEKGTWVSPETSYPEDGNVFWVESLERRPDTEREWEKVTTGVCGLPNETTTILPSPLGITTAQEATLVGFGVEDVLAVTDAKNAMNVPGYRWYAQMDAYGPSDAQPLELDENGAPVLTEGELPADLAALAETDPFYTAVIDLNGEGDYLSGVSEPVTEEGNVFWTHDIYAVPVDADGQDAGEAILQDSGIIGLPNETTKVLDLPDVVTQATPEVPFGGQAEDTATVTDPSGSIETLVDMGWDFDLTFNAYGPMKTPQCDGEAFYTSDVVSVTKPGDYLSGKTPAIKKGGNLYWVEDLVVTPVYPSGPGEPETVHEGECGLPNETTKVHAEDSSGGLASTGATVGLVAGGAALLTAAGAGTTLWARRGRIED